MCMHEGHLRHEVESSWTLHFKHSHWWKGWSPSKFASYYAWGTNGVCECKMDVNLHGFLMASNGPCFMVTWIVFKNHLLEVGLPQNQETMALQMLTPVDLVYFIMCEDPHEHTFIKIIFGWGPGHIWLHTRLEGMWPHYMILKVCWDGLGHFLLGSHNFMVMDLGSGVKWPLKLIHLHQHSPISILHQSHP